MVRMSFLGDSETLSPNPEACGRQPFCFHAQHLQLQTHCRCFLPTVLAGLRSRNPHNPTCLKNPTLGAYMVINIVVPNSFHSYCRGWLCSLCSTLFSLPLDSPFRDIVCILAPFLIRLCSVHTKSLYGHSYMGDPYIDPQIL